MPVSQAPSATAISPALSPASPATDTSSTKGVITAVSNVESGVLSSRASTSALEEAGRVLDGLRQETIDWGMQIYFARVAQAANRLIPGISLPFTAYQLFGALSAASKGQIVAALQRLPLSTIAPAALLQYLADQLKDYVPDGLGEARDHQNIVLGLATCALMYECLHQPLARQPQSLVGQALVKGFQYLRSGFNAASHISNVLAHQTALNATGICPADPFASYRPLPDATCPAALEKTPPSAEFPARLLEIRNRPSAETMAGTIDSAPLAAAPDEPPASRTEAKAIARNWLSWVRLAKEHNQPLHKRMEEYRTAAEHNGKLPDLEEFMAWETQQTGGGIFLPMEVETTSATADLPEIPLQQALPADTRSHHAYNTTGEPVPARSTASASKPLLSLAATGAATALSTGTNGPVNTLRRHPVKTMVGIGAAISGAGVLLTEAGSTLVSRVQTWLGSKAANNADIRREQAVLSLLSHTTHEMPADDNQPLQTTADKITALIAQHGGDRNNAMLQSEVIEVLKADGVWEAARDLLGYPPSAPAGVSAFPLHGSQATPIPDGASDNLVARALIAALLDANDVTTPATPPVEDASVQASSDEPNEQDARLFFLALQQGWRKDPQLSWLSGASETQQRNWLQLTANRDYAAEQLNQLLQLPGRRALENIRNELANRGNVGFPAESIILSVEQTVMGQPITANTTLAELAMKGIPSDPTSPWLFPKVYVEDESGVMEADAAFVHGIHEVLAAHPRAASEYGQDLHDLRTSKQVRDAHHRWLLSDFYLSSLTAELKGTLTGGRDAYVKGLDIIKAAQRSGLSDPNISTGTFTFFDSALRVPIRNWLGIVRYDEQGQEDGVVLYNAAQSQWSVFDDQSQMSQHLDLARLSQYTRTLDGRTEAGTIPLSRAVLHNADGTHIPQLRQSLQEIVDQPGRWRNDQLAFTPYPGRGFNEGMQHFSKDLLENILDKVESAHRKNPWLQKHAGDNALLSEALQAFVRERLPFSLSLDEFARRKASEDIAPWFVANGLVSDASEVDAATIKVSFNGVTASLPEWTLNVYRQDGDPFWGPDFKKEAEFSSSTGQDLSALQNNDAVKESLEGYLRRTYLGDQYADKVSGLLDPDNPLQKPLQDLRVAKELSDLRFALETGKATGYIQSADYTRMDRLLRSLPDSESTADGRNRIQYFAIGGIRIPGMYEITLADPSGFPGQPTFKRSYVYTPDAAHGQSLHKKQDFIELVKSSHPVREAILERALLKDRIHVDNALRAVQTDLFTTHPLPIPGFSQACDQLVRDLVDNADERTTSRLEVIEEQILKGVSHAVAAACLAAGPAGAVACAMGTSALMAKNIIDITGKARRGHLDEALWDAAFLWADVPDIAAGARPVVNGVKGLLKAVDRTHFSSVDEVVQAIETARRQQNGFLPDGHLNPTLAAMNMKPGEAVLGKPREGLSGEFYFNNNKYYIQDNDRMYEVFSDSGWTPDSIRLRDPQQPHAQGPLIHFKNGRWHKNVAGLLGGSPPAKRMKLRSTEDNASYQRMLSSGDIKASQRFKGKDVDAILSSNQAKLEGSVTELSDTERNFLAKIEGYEFEASHSTNYFAAEKLNEELNGSGKVTLFSRKQLIEKGSTIQSSNTPTADLRAFRTDDFVFFSIEPVGLNEKGRSRFLATKQTTLEKFKSENPDRFNDDARSAPEYPGTEFRFKMTGNQRFEDGIVQLYDPLATPKLKKSSIQNISQKSLKEIRGGYEVMPLLPDLIYRIGPDGYNMKKVFALKIIQLSRLITDTKERELLLAVSSPSEFNTLLNKLFRPQILVPNNLSAGKELVTASQAGS